MKRRFRPAARERVHESKSESVRGLHEIMSEQAEGEDGPMHEITSEPGRAPHETTSDFSMRGSENCTKSHRNLIWNTDR